MKRVQIQLPDEMAADVERYAKDTDQPVTAVVRHALTRLLAEGEQDHRWARALAGIGGFRSGLHDLSENHDEYFVQAIEERIGRR